jgi:uncharacterized protein (DUF302 family)
MSLSLDLRSIESEAPFEQVVARLLDLIRERGLTLFADIDHAQNARDAGLEMPGTRVLIFGSGKAGTPLMLAAPDLALELPLRILVRESSDGRAVLVYIDPGSLAGAFEVGPMAPAIAGIAAIAHAAAGAEPPAPSS